MKSPIVQSTVGVTLVGGAPVPARDLKIALARAPHAVAADSGADRLLAAGHRPEAVIGDFDSISAAARTALPSAVSVMISPETARGFSWSAIHRPRF